MTPPSDDTFDRFRDGGVLVTMEAPVEGTDPTALLRAFRGLPRGFWERQGRWHAWAGAAARIRLARGHRAPFSAVRAWADAAAGRLRPPGDGSVEGPPRFFGGFAFDAGDRAAAGGPRDGPDAAASPAVPGGPGARDGGASWDGFPAAAFHLPAVELRGAGEGARLRVTASSPEGAAAARRAAVGALERVRRRLSAAAEGTPPRAGAAGPGGEGCEAPAADLGPRAAPGVEGRRCRPGREHWRRAVSAALGAIRSGTLEKVVPARALELRLGEAPDPVGLVSRLRALNPGCFPYLVEPRPGPAFAGAAPEIVAARKGGRFHATAVAGTVPDSEDPAEQAELARQLLESPKDRVEHEIGVRDMRRALAEAVGVAEVDEEPRVLRLRGLQHLLTNVSADVPRGLHVLELLEAMHPTAAVNGTPRGEARAFLRRWEPFDRGWYAGPVGWFDAGGDGEFAPALRCALLRGREALLLAGAGVVRGSDPAREWEETALKFGPALEALGLDPEVEVDAARRTRREAPGLRSR